MKKIYIFSIFPWKSQLMHREHQLALAFRQLGYEVTFVERRYFVLGGLFPKERKEGGLKVRTLLALPYMRGVFSWVFKLNDWILKKQLYFLDKKSIALLSSPLWAKTIPNEVNVIYDMSDDVLGFTKNSRWLINLEKYEHYLLNRANLVVLTHKKLTEKVKSSKNQVIVENGVDVQAFSTARPVLANKYPGQIVGFVGGIFDWVDLDLVEEAIKEFPKETFVFIGPTNQTVKLNLLTAKYSNFHYLGAKPWCEIGNYLASFSVGLVPFVSEKEYRRLTTVNSNKIFQYSYFGYPVVSTYFNQVKDLSELIYVSKTETEFLQNLKVALEESDLKLRKKRKEFAKDHDWEHQAKAILGKLGG